MSADVYRVSYRPMSFLMEKEVELIADTLYPAHGTRYYIDEGALEELKKAGMDTEALQELKKQVKRSKYGGFDVSVS